MALSPGEIAALTQGTTGVRRGHGAQMMSQALANKAQQRAQMRGAMMGLFNAIQGGQRAERAMDIQEGINTNNARKSAMQQAQWQAEQKYAADKQISGLDEEIRAQTGMYQKAIDQVQKVGHDANLSKQAQATANQAAGRLQQLQVRRQNLEAARVAAWGQAGAQDPGVATQQGRVPVQGRAQQPQETTGAPDQGDQRGHPGGYRGMVGGVVAPGPVGPGGSRDPSAEGAMPGRPGGLPGVRVGPPGDPTDAATGLPAGEGAQNVGLPQIDFDPEVRKKERSSAMRSLEGYLESGLWEEAAGVDIPGMSPNQVANIVQQQKRIVTSQENARLMANARMGATGDAGRIKDSVVLAAKKSGEDLFRSTFKLLDAGHVIERERTYNEILNKLRHGNKADHVMALRRIAMAHNKGHLSDKDADAMFMQDNVLAKMYSQVRAIVGTETQYIGEGEWADAWNTESAQAGYGDIPQPTIRMMYQAVQRDLARVGDAKKVIGSKLADRLHQLQVDVDGAYNDQERRISELRMRTFRNSVEGTWGPAGSSRTPRGSRTPASPGGAPSPPDTTNLADQLQAVQDSLGEITEEDLEGLSDAERALLRE